MKSIVRLCTLILFFLAATLHAQSFSGGTGTELDPYLITNRAELEIFASRVNNGEPFADSFVKLANGFDMATVVSNPSFAPIGTATHPFKGTFDGDSHTIANLYISSLVLNDVGLFGRIDNATVRNLILTGVNVTGNENVGGLIGKALSSNVDTCVVSGVINASGNDAGGVIGYATYSNLTDCRTACHVEGEYYVGGLVGQVEGTSSATQCRATGNVTGRAENVGGLVGSFAGTGSALTGCSADAIVVGKNYTGGLLGYLWTGTTVAQCRAGGTVSGAEIVGGLIGGVWDANSVVNSYSIADVYGSECVSGLIGVVFYGNTAVMNCYSGGRVSSMEPYTGGITTNLDNATFTNCYYNATRNPGPMVDSLIVTPMRSVEMRCDQVFVDSLNDGSTTYTLANTATNSGYPVYATEALNAPVPTQVPAFSRQDGVFNAPFDLTLTAAEGATIYYSTDSPNFSVYAAPMTVSSSCTVWAYAEAPGALRSDIDSRTYWFDPTVEESLPPAFSRQEGLFTTPFSLSLTVEPGTVAYYSYDGVSYDIYNAPIYIKESTVVYAYAQTPGLAVSPTVRFNYTYMLDVTQAAEPVFSRISDVIHEPFLLELSCDAGDTIYYSTDGVAFAPYTAPLYIDTDKIIYAYADRASGEWSMPSDVISHTYEYVEIQTAAPLFSRFAGLFNAPFDLTLSAEAGATIYYSLDNVTYDTYNAPVRIDATCTVYAYAEAPWRLRSDTVINVYTYDPTVLQTPPPAFSRSGGSFVEPFQLTFFDASEVSIYYSYTGTNYQPYTGALYISTDCTVYAYAVRNGEAQSDIISKNFQYVPGGDVTLPPSYSRPSGTFSDSFVLTLAQSAGAPVYYSMDGVNYQTYSAPIVIASSCAVYAYATALGDAPSATLRMTYVYMPPLPNIADTAFYLGKQRTISAVDFGLTEFPKKTVFAATYADPYPKKTAKDKKVSVAFAKGRRDILEIKGKVPLVDKAAYKNARKSAFTLDIADTVQQNGWAVNMSVKNDGIPLTFLAMTPEILDSIVVTDTSPKKPVDYLVMPVKYAGTKATCAVEYIKTVKGVNKYLSMKPPAVKATSKKPYPSVVQDAVRMFNEELDITVLVFKLPKAYTDIEGRIDIVIDNGNGLGAVTIR